jgi:hypothetical protein
VSADDSSSSYLDRFKTVQPKVQPEEVGSSNKDVVTTNKDVGTSNKDVGTSNKDVGTSNKDVGGREEEVVTSEDSFIREAVRNSDSKITIWSPLTAAMLQYFRRKTPMFSMSSRGREIIESALEEKYPDLSKRIKDEMQKK